jgi:hypothetical protein
MSSGRILTQKVVKSQITTADFHQVLNTNLTQHDVHGPDDSPKTIDYHHLDMSRDDGMDEHRIDLLYGCHRVGFLLGKLLSNYSYDFHQVLTTNLTQHFSYGPDDSPKTIDHYHLDMSRDDGMDEHGIDWIYGCHRVGF